MVSIIRTATKLALRGGAAGASVSASLLNEIARRLRAAADGDEGWRPLLHEEEAPRLQSVDTGAAATTTRPAAEETPEVKPTVRRARPSGPAESPVRPSVADRTGSNTARSAGGRITKPKAARKVRKRQEAAAKAGEGGGP